MSNSRRLKKQSKGKKNKIAESVYNIFLFANENEKIDKLGVKIHCLIGDDTYKHNFLSNNLEKDLDNLTAQFDLMLNLKITDVMSRNHISGLAFDWLRKNGFIVSEDPLYCLIPLLNGNPFYIES